MIGIPYELAPSSLLYGEPMAPAAQELLKTSRASRQKCDWAQAERCALEAREICQEARDHIGLALAQLHLADFYGEVGETGRAVEECREAHRILRWQPARIQRYNEAVATYTLGLLHRLQLSGAIQALSWYQEALQLFETAREHLATLNDEARIKVCRQVCQQIEEHRRQIVTEIRAAPPSWRAAFSIWESNSTTAPFTRASDVRGYIVGDDQVEIDKITYRADTAIRADERHYHFALLASKDQSAAPGSQAGDYMFVCQQWGTGKREPTSENQAEPHSKKNWGVVWEPKVGWVTVSFVRGPDGSICFAPYSPKIIGADLTGKIKGHIMALLQRISPA